MRKIFLKTFILILIFSTYSIAQQQDLWITFTTADGLVNNEVNAICESKDGKLWIGTREGVSQYQDGIWATFTQSNGLAHNYVTAICESNNGALWFGTAFKGVNKYENGTWTILTDQDGLASINIWTICESSDGALWFGHWGAGVSRYKNGVWTTYTTKDGLAGDEIYSICESNDGALWFATVDVIGGVTIGTGVSRYNNGNWKTFTTSDGLADNRVLTIFESSDGSMWFGTRNGGVSRYKNEIWTTFTTSDGLADNNVKAIYESSDGIMWFGTLQGVSIFQNETWKSFTVNDGLADNSVMAICESSDGAVWIGTCGGGVNRYESRIWTTYTRSDGLAANPVYAICESNDGALWFGTWEEGISRYKNDVWTNFTTSNGLADDRIRAIYESNDGALWFGTFGGGVCCYQDGIWSNFNKSNGLADNLVFAIHQSSDSAMWFGTRDGGVSRYKNETWTTFTTSDGLADNYVKAIYESSDGTMWFGTEYSRVSRYLGGIWTTFTIADGLSGNHVTSIYESSDGALWFATWAGGISRYKDKVWTKFTTTDGLVNNNVRTICESKDGALWFGTRGGITRYHQGIWITFTTADGLVDNNVKAILESSDGALWFGTWGGVNRIKPDKIPPFTFIIEGPRNNSVTGTSTPMFIFSGKDYRTKQEELKYFYVVLDIYGIVVSGDSLDFFEETAVQPILPYNGTYTFCVSTRDKWGNVDPTSATRTFTVDLTQPTVIIYSLKQEQHIKGEVPIIGSAFDNSPIKDFNYYKLYYGVYIPEIQEPDWKQDKFTNLKSNEIRNDTLGIFNTIGLEDGLYQIKLWAIDTLKHESEDRVMVTIDNTKPMVEITSPKAGDQVSKKVDIYATINDVNIEKYSLEYKIVHQAKWQYLNQDTLGLSIENKLIYTWENSSDSGNVYLKLIAWDKAGNSTFDTVLFVLDNKESHLPTANILSPLNNAYLHDFVRIKGYATDKNFTKYTLSLIGENIDTLLIESDKTKENDVLFTLDTRSFPDDKYKIYLTVLNDKQYQKSDSISITIDNMLPSAKITFPLSDTISCYTLIQGEAYDENLKGITLKYAKISEADSSKFMLIDTTFTYWNTMELNGYYTLYLTVEDKGGLKTIDKRTYYIENPIFNQRTGLKKNQGEFSLYIPPNGYPASVICLEKRSMDEFTYNPEEITPKDLICEINSSIEEIQFNKPAVFTIDYTNNDLIQFDESKFRVFSWEDDNWNLLGGTLDEDKKIITTSINRLGIYGLFECQNEIETSDKGLQVDCQPRMFSPRGGGYSTETNISFYLGKDSNVTIKIFNMAGRLVNSLCENKFMTAGMNSIAWDGKDSSGRFCISGLYVILIQAEEKNATKTVMVLNK